MGEIPICPHCQRTVQVDDEDYVIPNKQAVDADWWSYEHAECYDEAMEQLDRQKEQQDRQKEDRATA